MKQKIMTALLALVALCAKAQHGEFVGGDISLLPAYEQSKTTYLDKDGKAIADLITWLRNDCGWNTFRVRLFVNPQQKAADGKTDYAVCQNLDYVKALGKRIKDAGAKFMLDIHYSDTWVDAEHIQAPAECKNMTADEKAAWINKYTREVLETLKANGATPDLVQVGNEIMYGFMGIKVAPYDGASGTDWPNYLKVLKQGCQAVRDICPEAKIIIHTDRPANQEYNKYYYTKLDNGGVTYDIIGLSYYPFWHGWLTAHLDQYNDGLINALQKLKTDFPEKKVQIVETAYNFQYWPTKGVNYDTQGTWPCSADGQYKFMNDLITELANHDNVNGLMYWCPEEAGNGDAADWNTKKGIVLDPWLNRGLWWSEKGGNNGHWPITSNGSGIAWTMKNFLSPASAIDNVTANTQHPTPDTQRIYNLNGQYVGNSTQGLKKGIYIRNNKKTTIH